MIMLFVAALASVARVEEMAKVAKAKAEILNLSVALENCRSENLAYTLSIPDLASAYAPPGIDKWRGPYLSRGIYLDPWNTPYLISLPGNKSFSGDFPVPGGSNSFAWPDYATNPKPFLRVSSFNHAAITYGSIKINGVTVADNLTSANLPQVFYISSGLLATGNQIVVSLAGDSFAVVFVSIPAVVPFSQSYLVTSLGADRKTGGLDTASDVAWDSRYADFTK